MSIILVCEIEIELPHKHLNCLQLNRETLLEGYKWHIVRCFSLLR